jgi:uncharacterized protein YhfF
MKLKGDVKDFWDEYVASLPKDKRPKKQRVTAAYAGDRNITNGLIGLYLTGKKTAGSSLVEDFNTAGDPLPKAGDYWVILGSAGRPRCIVKTIKTVQHKFPAVPADIAKAEGEGDQSLDYWRKTHAALWARDLKKWGLASINDATVITEFFEVVYPIPLKLKPPLAPKL